VIFDLNTSRYHVILYPLGGGWWFEDSRWAHLLKKYFEF
jgi:acetyl esterase/lipase